MNPMERADHAPEEFARNLAEQQAGMQEARSLTYSADSRTRLLTRFLQAMADRVDPTGEARRGMR
jgi:hypothetical protein